MKLQTILLVGVVIELCFVPLLDAKRSFGITRSRNKGKGPSVRRNQQGHEYDDNPMPAVHPPKPSAPEMKKPVSHSAPAGPPPPYPGLGHNTPIYGAPPAYSSSYGAPPAYSAGMGGMSHNQPRFGQSPAAFGSYSQPMHGQAMPMGVVPMGSYNYGNRGGGSGMMTNLFAGLAGYQLARAFGGGGYGHHHHHQPDREVIILDNRQQPVGPQDTSVPLLPLNEKPSTDIVHGPSTEIPQEPMDQVGPANNEYNHYGLPQYGVPLYGYNMPGQITDYYQSAMVHVPRAESEHTPDMGRK